MAHKLTLTADDKLPQYGYDQCQLTFLKLSDLCKILGTVRWQQIQTYSKLAITRAKDVLLNVNRTQATEISTPGSDGMVPSAAEWCYLQRARSIPSLPGVIGVHGAFSSLVTLIFDLWYWPPNSSQRGTKHVFRVNLAQIRSAVPEIFDSQKNKMKKNAHRQR